MRLGNLKLLPAIRVIKFGAQNELIEFIVDDSLRILDQSSMVKLRIAAVHLVACRYDDACLRVLTIE